MSKIKSHLSLITANLIYGGNFTIAKQIMPVPIKPFGFILLRVLSVLLIFLLLQPFLPKEKVSRKDMLLLFLSGIFGVAINQLLFFKGLAITTPINAALIITTTPILVLIAASIIIKENITSGKIIGIISGATGAVLIILFGKTVSFGKSTIPGDIFVFINAMSFGVYFVIIKPLMLKYHPATIMKWIFAWGLIFVVPFGYTEFISIPWSEFSFSIWTGIAYVVIGATLLAYFLNNIALQALSPATASMYIYLQPVFATTIAVIWGKDKLSFLHIIATILIFTGVYLVSNGNGKQITNHKS